MGQPTAWGAEDREILVRAFREESGRIVAALIRLTGDWDLAEECTQDAFMEALRTWPESGVPSRPGAWLTTVARNRAYDRLRRATTESSKLRELAALTGDAGPGDPDDAAIPDDRLRLMFTCCHPALPLEARVALTLRTLAGLTTAEIAHAFLLPTPTMAKRLVRAKQKIKNAAIPFRVPPPNLLPERTSGMLAVLYLLFNEGYASSGGVDLARDTLCTEAIRLTRALVEMLPAEPEAAGLLALMLLQHSRIRARVDPAGDMITLEDQDRSLWDRAEIDEALALLDRTLNRRRIGPYQIQAAIAACHAEVSRAADTDWARIASLYARLAEMTPSPVVELNRAVAVAMVDGPETALRMVDDLDASGRLRDYHLLPALRADLLRRLGRRSDAAASYRRALGLTANDAERRYLSRRLEEVTGAARA
ncbi:RNA polymerase subunit sigma-24 [Actinoplanes cyaneus]|uniref:RNA polymerase subunit sigma-24 n=1 Tax=Actinoplanes cyaneus TaxID=52696 RepID=A0A919ISH9_9ACTN|nr:RNA polymerase sigma factor [Actinoplanes cyaneus]MCW2138192.1 RNA polymerase, sigma subunit, ECF family [Actinoplanes cyaneus]GID70512.1 RNA polymerase subunit sigma-24 [Actinoplanes cyaneus]